jgi:hypothetical protein
LLPPLPQLRCRQAADAAATSAASTAAAVAFIFILIVVAAATTAVLPPRFHCRYCAAANALAQRCRVGWSFRQLVGQLAGWLVGQLVSWVGRLVGPLWDM